jgi:NitT/TauT family transport system substrate-binding protein
MKKTKKLTAILLAALLCAAIFAGCAKAPVNMNIGALMGPTGMGIVGLMDEKYAENYTVSISSAPDDVTASFISGAIDVAAVPINVASVLYNKLEGDVVMLCVNTLGVLYVLEQGDTVNGIADLAGKKLYATGQGATPEYVINYLLEQNGIVDQVEVEYKAEHSELATLLASGEVTLGMLPEPNVTATLAQNANLRVALDLTDEWDKVSDTTLVQGCVIARRAFVEENGAAIDQFLKDYNDSVTFVNGNKPEASLLIEQYGILPKAAVAEKAIDNCNIVCWTGGEMKAAAEGMLQVLFSANPQSVGGALPGADLYYGAK